ncbi:hypothetical protein ACQP04_24585 [Pseudonocardia halophobica]|uniref:hypothetical protein n=1 Tax=Pseudonocardia halophobica TaxID=29401 RepID=UPI003D8A3858
MLAQDPNHAAFLARAGTASCPASCDLAVARVDALPRDVEAGKVRRRRLDQTGMLEWITT